MTPLILSPTEDTPEISFDNTSGKLMMSGTSIPENARKFYDVVIDWISQYAQSPCESTSINFKLKYFNTASTKYLFDIMVVAKDIMKNGKTLVINWFYMEDDEDMYEAGMGFSKMLRYPFNFVKY